MSNKQTQFHANPTIFQNPYYNVPCDYLSSLATCPNQAGAGCPNQSLAGCTGFTTPGQIQKMSADVWRGAGAPLARSIPLASKEHFHNGNGGYVTIGDQTFDTTGIIAPNKHGWSHPVVSPPGTEWLGTRHYANPTLAQMNGQIQWTSKHA